MKPTFKEYFEANEDEIISSLEEEIDMLDVPSNIKNELHNVINANIYEILEARYNKACDDYDEQKYEEYKEGK